MEKFKRLFEVSSVVCSTASIYMVIACLYGGVPVFLGYKSQEMIFDFAFSLLVASVLSFALAIATSRMQDTKLEIYFSSIRISTFISSLLKSIFCSKKKDCEGCENLCYSANTQPALRHAKCTENLKDEINNQEYSDALENLLEKKSEDAQYSFKNTERSALFPPSSDKSSQIKSIPRSQEYHTPIILRHCSMEHSPNFTKSRKLMLFDLKRMGKKSKIIPDFKQPFVTNGNFNEVNPRNVYHKRPKVGIVSPVKTNCSSDVEHCDLLQETSPSVDGTRICREFPRKRFHPISLQEQESFYQNKGRLPDEHFKVDDNMLYSASAKYFPKFPGSQKVEFNNRLQTTHLQNLQEEQNKFPTVRCENSSEICYTEHLQNIQESVNEFSNKILEIGRSNLQEIQKVDSRNNYKLHRKVVPAFKNFQDSFRNFEEAPYSKIGRNEPHSGLSINSKDWSESFIDEPDIPMEICNTSPNDKVLEVSMKLKDLHFMF